MNVLAKLTEKCGPDSTIPQVMAMDALFAGEYFVFFNKVPALKVLEHGVWPLLNTRGEAKRRLTPLPSDIVVLCVIIWVRFL